MVEIVRHGARLAIGPHMDGLYGRMLVLQDFAEKHYRL